MSEVRIPEGWEKNIIGSCLKISTGDKDTQDKIEDGKYPFFVRSNIIERLNSYSFEGEAVLTAGDGVGVGKVFHHYDGKFAFHQRVYAIYGFNKEIDGKYFYNFFSSKFLQEIEKYSAKTSVDSVRRPMIFNMEILLPPLQEQQKIAEILSEVDSAIDKTKQLIEKNKRLKTALMQDLLNYGIDENGQIRNPKTNQFKPSPLGDIPVEWKVKDIKEVLQIASGKDYKHLKEGNIPVYGTGGYMISVNDFLHNGESVCIGRKGTIDNPMFVTGKFWTVDTLFYTHSFINCVPKFIYLLFLNINWKLYNEASGVPSLSKKAIEAIKIKLPQSKTEQQKIADILSSQDEKIEKLQNKLTKLNHLKTSLMQDLLSGKVRVTKLLESKQ